MKDTRDEAILEAYALGERQALDELVRRHHPAARRLAAAVLGDSAAAEDAVQEAFIALAESSRRFEGRSFAAWWHGILMNKIKMERRRRAIKLRHERAYPSRRAPLPRSDPSQDLELRDALGSLPIQQQSALILKYYEGCSQDEVAARLGCSPATAKRRIRRGLERLRRGLGLAPMIVIPELEALLRAEAPPRSDAAPPSRLQRALEEVEPRAARFSGLVSLALGFTAIALATGFALARIHREKIVSNANNAGAGVTSTFSSTGGEEVPGLSRPKFNEVRARNATRRFAIKNGLDAPERVARLTPGATLKALPEEAIVAYRFDPELERLGGAAEARLRYQLVDLALDDAPLRLILEELGRRAGVPLDLSPELEAAIREDPPLITARLTGRPLIAALRQVFGLWRAPSFEPRADGSLRIDLGPSTSLAKATPPPAWRPDLRAVEDEARSRARAVTPAETSARERLNSLLARSRTAREEARSSAALRWALRGFLLAESLDPRGGRRDAAAARFLIEAFESAEEALRAGPVTRAEREDFERLAGELRARYLRVMSPPQRGGEATGR